MSTVRKTRDYRLLLIGQGVSHLGDQFHLIALPWLVLALTHDPFQLGLVLACAGFPRAIFMLAGGAFADRLSPRSIMLVSDAVRFLLVGLLSLAILMGSVHLWMIYAMAIGFGIVSGFFTPAAQAALPRLLERDQLEGGNALMMGVTQITSFVGPALAGTLIAFLGAPSRTLGLEGSGIAMGIDALSFAFSAFCLLLMHSLDALQADAGKHPLAAVAEGLRFALTQLEFRWLLGLFGAANFFVMGPLTVGVPVLAQTRFPEGAAAYGVIMSAYALGNLGGYLVAGIQRRPSSRMFSVAVVALFLLFGLFIAGLGLIASTWLCAALMVLLGLGNGYLAVLMMSALQRMAPEQMLGRLMSLVALAMLGLAPLSQTIAGWAIKLGPLVLFGLSGVLIACTGLLAGLGYRSWSLDIFGGQVTASH